MFRVDWNVHFCFVIIFATVRSFIQKREDNLKFCFAKKIISHIYILFAICVL